MRKLKFILPQNIQILLQKKSDIIESYTDLRVLAIIPTVIMTTDKIINPYIRNIAKRSLYPHNMEEEKIKVLILQKLNY